MGIGLGTLTDDHPSIPQNPPLGVQPVSVQHKPFLALDKPHPAHTIRYVFGSQLPVPGHGKTGPASLVRDLFLFRDDEGGGQNKNGSVCE